MIGPDGAEWVSIGDAARRVRVREDLVRQWKARGKVRAVRVGRVTVVHLGDVAVRERDWRHRATRRVIGGNP